MYLWHDEVYELIVAFTELMATRDIKYSETNDGRILIKRSNKSMPASSPGILLYNQGKQCVDFDTTITMTWQTQNEALQWILDWFNKVIQGKSMDALTNPDGNSLVLIGHLEGLILLGKPHNIMLTIKSTWIDDNPPIKLQPYNKEITNQLFKEIL